MRRQRSSGPLENVERTRWRVQQRECDLAVTLSEDILKQQNLNPAQRNNDTMSVIIEGSRQHGWPWLRQGNQERYQTEQILGHGNFSNSIHSVISFPCPVISMAW